MSATQSILEVIDSEVRELDKQVRLARSQLASLESRLDRLRGCRLQLQLMFNHPDAVSVAETEEIPYRFRQDEIMDFVRLNPGLYPADVCRQMISQGLTNASKSSLESKISRMVRSGVLIRDSYWRVYAHDADPSLYGKKKTRREQVLEFVEANPGLTQLQIAHRMVEEDLVDTTVNSISCVISNMCGWKQRFLDRDRDGIISVREKPGRVQEKEVEYAIGYLIRQFLVSHPRSTKEEIVKAIHQQKGGFYEDVEKATMLPLRQGVYQKRFYRDAEGLYSIADKNSDWSVVAPKNTITSQVIAFLGKQPGLKCDAIDEELDGETTSAKWVLAHLVRTERVIRRSDDTYWLPSQNDLMESTPLGTSDKIERQQRKKFESIKSVLKLGEDANVQ